MRKRDSETSLKKENTGQGVRNKRVQEKVKANEKQTSRN